MIAHVRNKKQAVLHKMKNAVASCGGIILDFFKVF